MDIEKRAMSLPTGRARLEASICQVMGSVLKRLGALLLALIGLGGVASAEICTMYEKYVKAHGGAGTLCESTPNFVEVEVEALSSSPPGTATYYARKVPKCDITGTDDGCPLKPRFLSARLIKFEDSVKSLDGTRAFYYIDPNPSSNEWVFFFDGGGSCGEMLGSNAAKACYAADAAVFGFDGYDKGTGDACEMTTKHAAGTCTVPDRKSGEGILSPEPANPYAAYNRVWFNKSSFDRFMGNTNHTKLYDGDDIELYFHGRRIIQAVIKELDRPAGVSFSVGGETVPDLSSATRVLFAGESGGAGGLIHNAQWIKDRIVEVSPNIKVSFALASRMLPWIEAEAKFDGTGNNNIWDERFSGTTIVRNNDTNGVDAAISYSERAFKPGGDIRMLLNSWGDITSTMGPFLNEDCKNHHYDDDHDRWKCYDEGHLALYHMNENVFFFESLDDSVHAGSASPVFWMDSVITPAGIIPLNPGLVWSPDFTRARSERVLYTVNSILSNPHHRGMRGFYVPDVDAHTMVKKSAFYDRVLHKNGLSYSFAGLLRQWQLSNANSIAMDAAVVQDGAFSWWLGITWSSTLVPQFGGGWAPRP